MKEHPGPKPVPTPTEREAFEALRARLLAMSTGKCSPLGKIASASTLASVRARIAAAEDPDELLRIIQQSGAIESDPSPLAERLTKQIGEIEVAARAVLSAEKTKITDAPFLEQAAEQPKVTGSALAFSVLERCRLFKSIRGASAAAGFPDHSETEAGLLLLALDIGRLDAAMALAHRESMSSAQYGRKPTIKPEQFAEVERVAKAMLALNPSAQVVSPAANAAGMSRSRAREHLRDRGLYPNKKG